MEQKNDLIMFLSRKIVIIQICKNKRVINYWFDAYTIIIIIAFRVSILKFFEEEHGNKFFFTIF